MRHILLASATLSSAALMAPAVSARSARDPDVNALLGKRGFPTQ